MRTLLILVAILLPLAARADIYSPQGSFGTPSVASCGTSPSVAGTDSSGTITVGSGTVTSCQLNFSATMPVVPSCTISTSATVVTRVSALSASSMTVAFASSSPSVKVYYACNLK